MPHILEDPLVNVHDVLSDISRNIPQAVSVAPRINFACPESSPALRCCQQAASLHDIGKKELTSINILHRGLR